MPLIYTSACSKDEQFLERVDCLTLISHISVLKIIRPSLDNFLPALALLSAINFLTAAGFNKVDGQKQNYL